MKLQFKPDIDRAIQLWDNWWQGTSQRPYAYLAPVKPNTQPVDPPSQYAIAFGSLTETIDQVLEWAASHVFVEETIPCFEVSFGPDHMAALLGGDLIQREESSGTTWVRPFVDDWRSAPISFGEDGYWWKRTVESIRAYRKRCDGKLLLYESALHTGLDGLATIRGVDNLMLDLVTDPEGVHKALGEITACYRRIKELIGRELYADGIGFCNRYNMHSTGPMAVLQCDASCMISPQMYRQFVLPYTIEESKAAGRAVYHVDGEDAIKHVDSLLEVENVAAVQCKPLHRGDVASSAWLGVYDKIRNSERGLIVMTTDLATIDQVHAELRYNKVYFNWFKQSLVHDQGEEGALMEILK